MNALTITGLVAGGWLTVALPVMSRAEHKHFAPDVVRNLPGQVRHIPLTAAALLLILGGTHVR